VNLVINASDAVGDGNGLIQVRTGLRRIDQLYLDETFLSPTLLPATTSTLKSTTTAAACRRGESPHFRAVLYHQVAGHGLGLAAVLGIVRTHHGTIRVDSEAGVAAHSSCCFPLLGRLPRPSRRRLILPPAGAEPAWRS